MKRIFLTMMMVMCIGLIARAQVRVETRIDSAKNQRIEIEVMDTVRNGKAEVDTLSITTIPLNSQYQSNRQESVSLNIDDDWDNEELRDVAHFLKTSGSMIVAIVFVSILAFLVGPLLILGLIFYYRHKNRKAKYELAAKMIENGQPLPEDLEETVRGLKSMESKGIKNICIGAAIFVFIWAMTDSIGLACVGLLILANGVSQYIIATRENERKLKEELRQERAKKSKNGDNVETVDTEEVKF